MLLLESLRVGDGLDGGVEMILSIISTKLFDLEQSGRTWWTSRLMTVSSISCSTRETVSW